MTLQLIHTEVTRRRACFLYCHWVRVSETSGAPLRAIWIDRDMREFELQFELPLPVKEEFPESTVDEPGPWQESCEFVHRFGTGIAN